jgi:ribonuclease P protein component
MSDDPENTLKIVPVLQKRKDFLRVAALRKKWNAPGMIVQIAPQPKNLGADIPNLRVGYTASKKVGNSVARSRVKRRLREVVRLILADKGQENHDYVIIGRPETLERSFDDLIRDLKWCIKRLKDGPRKVKKLPNQNKQ